MPRDKHSNLLPVLLCLAVVTLIIQLFYLSPYSYPIPSKHENNSSAVELPGSFPDAAIFISPVDDRLSISDDKTWIKLLAPLRGFVYIGQEREMVNVAMYHQIHCINAIRFYYTMARDGFIVEPKKLEGEIKHLDHCFHSVRQAILCSGDQTLLPLSPNVSFVDTGLGNLHRCRDWTSVHRKVLELHAASQEAN